MKEESRLREKAKADLATKLTTLRGQVDKEKAYVVAEFRVSQPFFVACGAYHGDGFDNCIKQVGSIYPNLDLSQITINDTVSPTLGGDGTVSEEPDGFAHTVKQESKDDDVVVA